MDTKTLEALRGSIRKWEKIVDGTEMDRGLDNCPLCRIFHGVFRTDDKYGCFGCPVAEAVYDTCCEGTPYNDYNRTPTKENAQRELDFLISLLPPGVSKDA